MKKILKLLIVIFLCTVLFFGSSFLYLNHNLKESEKTVDEKVQNVPYSKTPENCGILLKLPNDENILFFLDFEEVILYIINVEEYKSDFQSYVGYPIDYKCEIDYYTLSLFLDRIGGIDLEDGGEFLRFSGIQICELLSKENSSKLSFDITDAVCDKLSTAGLADEDFVFLIGNCDTDLSMPVCIYWKEYLSTLFSNRVFVNWET